MPLLRPDGILAKHNVAGYGDKIEFHQDGTARVTGLIDPVHTEGGTVYSRGQFSNGCKYTQETDKVTLTCPNCMDSIFRVNTDGSLTGPADGLDGAIAFAHMVRQK
jgi:hypothetical protein